MRISALRAYIHSGFTEKHISHLRTHYRPEAFEKMLRAVLTEAGRLGPALSDGPLYLSSVRVSLTYRVLSSGRPCRPEPVLLQK